MLRSRLLLVVLFALVLISCASFPQNQLPQIDSLPVISENQHKPSAYIEVFYRFNDRGPAVAGIEQGRRMVQGIVRKITRKAAIFDDFTFDKAELPGKDYIISIDMLNYGNEDSAYFAGMLFAMSLGTIPIWATDNYTLSAKVFDATGRLLAEYRFNDSLRTYFHLFFIFTTKSRPKNTCEIVLSNMVRNFYQRLYDEKIIKFGDQNFACLDYGRR